MFSIVDIPNKGKGLIATTNIPRGTVVFDEKPLVVSQFLYNAKFFPVCSHCFTSLEKPDEMLMRIAGLDSKPQLPFLQEYLALNPVASKVYCSSCSEMYCSEQCKLQASRYHKRLCGNAIVDELKQWWMSFHYPPEELSPILLLRILSMILADVDDGKTLQQALEPWQTFGQGISTQDASVFIRFLNQEFENKMQQLIKFVKDALYREKCPELFSTEAIVSLFAAIARNAQGVGTGTYDMYRRFVLNLPESQQKEEALDFLDTFADPIEDVSGQFTLAEGSGLYLLHKNLNHDCDPNCNITFPYNSAQLQVKAINDIPQGTEITISYLEVVGSDHEHVEDEGEEMEEDDREEEEDAFGDERRQKLREYYLFDCNCRRCQQELVEKNQ